MRGRSLVAVSLVVLLGGAWALYGAVAYTNTPEFCTSCHVMERVTAEYRERSHFQNARGFRATCADCHVPPGVVPTLRSKVRALHSELIPWIMGVDTPEELEARRVHLGHEVWEHMRLDDSAACRSCHVMTEEVLSLQDTRARTQHLEAEQEGQTCIDCHDDGLAHRTVKAEAPEEEEEWEDDFTL